MYKLEKSKRILGLCLMLFINLSIYSQGTYGDEDMNNDGVEFSYTQPDFNTNMWSAYSLKNGNPVDMANGNILKNVAARSEWVSPMGFYGIWYGAKEYIFNLPVISGGQIAMQWKDLAPKKNKYDFSMLDKMLKAYFDRKLYTTIQINGNQHPDWMFDEIPYLAGGQLDTQVEDTKGTLMYWYPSYVDCYKQLLDSLGAYLSSTPYLKSVIGIRYNLNAIGTEKTTPPSTFTLNGKKIDPRNTSSYTYPSGANKSFTTYWSSALLANYQTAVYQGYDSSIKPYAKIFLRNIADPATIDQAMPDILSGKTGFFHTSSEPEPRGSGGENKLAIFNQYSRTPYTISYTEDWADSWGNHGGTKEDPHFCYPQQWNYWRILCDLNVGVSQIAMYGSTPAYAMGAVAPGNTQFPDSFPPIRKNEMRRGIEFGSKYIGQHNDPMKSPGAFIAFRQSTVNSSIQDNPGYYVGLNSSLSTFTTDYSFLSLRLPNNSDNSVGVKLVGSKNQRFGAFARKLPQGGTMKIALHPSLTKALYRKDVELRVIYFDDSVAKWSIQYGNNEYTVKSSGTKTWQILKLSVQGAERVNPLSSGSIIEKGTFATNTELNSLNPDIIINALIGSPIFHMVEIDRSTLYPDMYSELGQITAKNDVISLDQFNVKVIGTKLIFSNLNIKYPVEIYDIQGRKIASYYFQNSISETILKNKGVFIIRNGDHHAKIII